MKRQSGILMPIFSLPSKYGIGSFGKEAYKFVDFLKASNQKVWQILPLVQTGYGNSPYSSVSAESFNPYFISLDNLRSDNLITAEELSTALYNGKYIDYGNVYNVRFSLLRKAFERFDKNNADFVKFVKKGEFKNYAIYMSLRIKSGYKPFYEWEEGYKFRFTDAIAKFVKENKEDVLFWQFVQFRAKTEWSKLKKYANDNGIKIMGDMPLYMAHDSVDVWVNPQLFKLNKDLYPEKVAGVPPDYFSKTGQLWGNPVYDYESHKIDGYSWWAKRLKKALATFDYVRIDHFRGLDRYYEIDSYRENAIIGEWIDVPSEELFESIHKAVDKKRIIAEDLGIIDDGVRALLKHTGYPGMKILSFAFNGQADNLYLPENIEANSVCYTGTHDNDTLMGLIASASEWDYKNLVNGVKNSYKLLGKKKQIASKTALAKNIIELGANSKANLFILPYQDVIGLDSSYRINEPGTVKEQNWAIRFNASDFSKGVSDKLSTLTKQAKR